MKDEGMKSWMCGWIYLNGKKITQCAGVTIIQSCANDLILDPRLGRTDIKTEHIQSAFFLEERDDHFSCETRPV